MGVEVRVAETTAELAAWRQVRLSRRREVEARSGLCRRLALRSPGEDIRFSLREGLPSRISPSREFMPRV